MLVRPRSALGLKYVEITKGTSSKGFADGAIVPLSARQAAAGGVRRVPRDVRRQDARTASAATCASSATRWPGRGLDLNRAIEAFNPLLRNLTPVMTNLGDPRTRLVAALPGARPHAGEVAPVAEQQADAVREPRHHVRARSPRRAADYQHSIQGAPPALDAAIRELPAPAAVPGQQRRAVPRPAPGRRGAARRRAPTWPTLRDRHRVAAPQRRRSTAGSSRLRRRCSASPRTRWSRSASRTSPTPRQILKPTIDATSRRPRPPATT